MTCESAFCVAGMGLCGIQANVDLLGCNGVVAAVYRESEKECWFVMCESACRVAGLGLCGTQAKVVLGVSNGVVAAVYGKSKKR